jgi:hypothetical protein
MVGGRVIGITRQEGRTHVNVADCQHYPKCGIACKNPQTCCVYTDEVNQRTGERVEIQVGDAIWWQSGSCMWTPASNRRVGSSGEGGVDYDIRLTKIGYSH